MRPVDCLIASVATAIGYFLISQSISNELFLAIIVVFIICGAGQTINDVFDAKIDSKINKNKPIPSKRISGDSALLFSLGLFILGIAISFFINPVVFSITILFSILLIVYSALLFKIKFVGNFVVAAGTAFTFILGSASAGMISNLIIIFTLSAFFANMGRELTKDLEDLKKDKGFKKTLPMISKRISKDLIAFYYFLAITFAVSALAINPLNFLYVLFIAISAGIFGIALLEVHRENYSISQSNSKKGMVLSLLAFVSAIFK